MKIAFVYPHSVIPVPRVHLFDALAVVTYELARRLAADHEVVAYPRRAAAAGASQVHEGVTYRPVAVGFDRALSLLKATDRLGLTAPERPFRTSRLYFPRYVRQVARDIAKRDIELVHIHNLAGFIPEMRKRNPRARIVLHSHDHAIIDFDHGLAAARLRDAALILGCSDFVTRDIQRRFPELEARCETLHNGVGEVFFRVESRPEASKTILFVGRLSPEKGVHVLLEAFRDLASRDPEARLILVGPSDLAPKQFVDPFRRDPLISSLEHYYGRPGRYRRFLERIAEPVAERVAWAGAVPNHRLREYLARAAVFAFPSVFQEPFGIPVIEAMAAGLPVVATAAGGIPELVQESETGALVERGDSPALAGALERLLSDPDLRGTLGDAGRARARERFTWDLQAERLSRLYRRYCVGE